MPLPSPFLPPFFSASADSPDSSSCQDGGPSNVEAFGGDNFHDTNNVSSLCSMLKDCTIHSPSPAHSFPGQQTPTPSSAHQSPHNPHHPQSPYQSQSAQYAGSSHLLPNDSQSRLRSQTLPTQLQSTDELVDHYLQTLPQKSKSLEPQHLGAGLGGQSHHLHPPTPKSRSYNQQSPANQQISQSATPNNILQSLVAATEYGNAFDDQQQQQKTPVGSSVVGGDNRQNHQQQQEIQNQPQLFPNLDSRHRDSCLSDGSPLKDTALPNTSQLDTTDGQYNTSISGRFSNQPSLLSFLSLPEPAPVESRAGRVTFDLGLTDDAKEGHLKSTATSPFAGGCASNNSSGSGAFTPGTSLQCVTLSLLADGEDGSLEENCDERGGNKSGPENYKVTENSFKGGCLGLGFRFVTQTCTCCSFC